MKRIAFAITIIGTAALISCGPSPENKTVPTDTATGAGSLMNESTYDPTKIDASAPVVEVTLHTSGNTMAEMKFDQTEIRVKEKTTVKLTLINGSQDSSMLHNFVLIDDGTAEHVATEGMKAGPDADYTPSISSVYVHTKNTLPGETVSITFPAPEKGTYEFICSYPGHWQKMRGKFIVE